MADPIIIAHRGASGYLPEHTLESATLAHALGADYIEQDLVLSKDNVLLVLHDIYLDTTTNVEQRFPDRARDDGRYYALDFTLQEIKSLIVHERTDAEGNPVYPDRYRGHAEFKLATFEEHIELVANLNRQFNRNAGLYPEIKQPKWHRDQGYDISAITVEMLNKHNLNQAETKIFMQCFDFNENKRLRQELDLKSPLIQLIAENEWQESDADYDYLQSHDGLAELSHYVQGIGPWIPQVIDLESGVTTALVSLAHAHQLEVHPYTFRVDELGDLPATDALDRLFKVAKIDGLFTDFSDVVGEYLQHYEHNDVSRP